MLKHLRFIRAVEWWEYKLAPMFGVAYIVIAGSSFTITNLLPLLGMILAALTAGAVFVSLLNDATDIEPDMFGSVFLKFTYPYARLASRRVFRNWF